MAQAIKKKDLPNEILKLKNGRQLAYGENRCQSPAFLFDGGGDNPLAISKFEIVSGDPSYIAMADVSQLVGILCLMSEAFRNTRGKDPYIVIAGKHGNPCGCAIDWDYPEKALEKALLGDPVAVMGGEVITNFGISEIRADKLFYSDKEKIGRDKWGLDVIAAPDFSSEAIELLGKREKRRLLKNPNLVEAPFPKEEWTYRELHGGDWLKQRLSPFILSPAKVIDWTCEEISYNFIANLIIAFACCWRASSNTVALAKNQMLIGLGCGQQDRIACVRLCLDRANRAGHNAEGSVFASDAFFPYAKSETDAKEIKRLTAVAKQLHNNLIDKETDERINILNNFINLFSCLDRREGPELLADAGCIGGIVPADGNNLEQVKKFFQSKNMSVAFVAPENRGFSKH